ncbi:DUF3761 domain-containing protein [Streptomyces sp. UNOB3_S3]|nr:DUF3761 domain-containing protein [Streptomyces sp. UNOB3_S3]
MRVGMAALVAAGSLLVPVAAGTTAQAAIAGCAHHTTGTCKAGSHHPEGATAQCKDKTYSYSAHFRGTCSHHRGVRYWYK